MALFGQEHGAGLIRKPLYKRAWFWGAVLILAAFSWYLQGYFQWKGGQIEKNTENILAYTYWQFTERQQKTLEEAYKRDTYGGETPEETLRLFIEALEKKDYELAAKYFLPEKQKEAAEIIVDAEASGGMRGFIKAYRAGKVVPPNGVGSSGIYEFELFEPGSAAYPFRVRIVKNEFTNKWKILEL